jgi:riboflavin kinase/FMN adenylyltransferase
MNVGVRPTFHGRRAEGLVCEVHLPGLRGSLYGRHLDVDVLSRLRSERTFASSAALRRQIQRDLVRAGLPVAPLP